MNEREKLLKAGVRNLREFGYPEVNEMNILTDPIYGAFFRSMLEEHGGVIALELIQEIENA